MKRSLFVIVGCMLLFVLKAQDADEPIPYKEGVDPEFLTGLIGRFEISGGVGYAFINNLTSNTKTTTLSNYNHQLSGGLKADFGVGYNFTNFFQVRLSYGYRTTNASDLYTLNPDTDTASVLYLEDDYHFHQMDASILYRFKLARERLFLVPEVGIGYLFFNNTGVLNDAYIQKNSGLVFNAGVGFDYLASDIIGIGLHSNYNYTYLSNLNLDYPSEELHYVMEADKKFGFVDLTIKLLFFF